MLLFRLAIRFVQVGISGFKEQCNFYSLTKTFRINAVFEYYRFVICINCRGLAKKVDIFKLNIL